MNVMLEANIIVSSSEYSSERGRRRFSRVMAFLLGMCVATTGESFAGSDNKINYKECGAFVFDNEDDEVLSSYNNSFNSAGMAGKCEALLSAGNRTPFLGATDSWGDWFNSRIALMIRRNEDYTLPGFNLCRDSADYNACMEKSVLTYYGFRLDDRQRWRFREYESKIGSGESLEQSMSNILDGTIERRDGITVFGVWRYPDGFYDGPKKWWVALYIIRHAPFGYVILSNNPKGNAPLSIPQNSTPESRAQTIELIDRLVQIVQSVRMK
ncbi:hypothetical protein BLA14095_00530 [Burkholderia lata]|uniref:hypothetical protein n=1 Tax=Burkholderia lata (strain ATCC 17760 / DSM 23089 / LMG 22485 / NCIMB 9086 / R18194 / 383) TaxID=482957 RepID=UPI0014535192|nr:hypothetical protein [Burkholderia lata]VWB17548.1 hypothetical protein BLA14095_00530 [Burkholderia lata]